VIAAVVVVGHEGLDLVFQVAWQVVVLQQDAVFQRLMPTLNLAQGEMINGTSYLSWLEYPDSREAS
jgi:hypothetical protein